MEAIYSFLLVVLVSCRFDLMMVIMELIQQCSKEIDSFPMERWFRLCYISSLCGIFSGRRQASPRHRDCLRHIQNIATHIFSIFLDDVLTEDSNNPSDSTSYMYRTLPDNVDH